MTTPPTSVTPIKISPVDETDAGLWRRPLAAALRGGQVRQGTRIEMCGSKHRGAPQRNQWENSAAQKSWGSYWPRGRRPPCLGRLCRSVGVPCRPSARASGRPPKPQMRPRD